MTNPTQACTALLLCREGSVLLYTHVVVGRLRVSAHLVGKGHDDNAQVAETLVDVLGFFQPLSH